MQPAVGESVAEGTKVTLTVSKGNVREVPDVVGLSQDDATRSSRTAASMSIVQDGPEVPADRGGEGHRPEPERQGEEADRHEGDHQVSQPEPETAHDADRSRRRRRRRPRRPLRAMGAVSVCRSYLRRPGPRIRPPAGIGVTEAESSAVAPTRRWPRRVRRLAGSRASSCWCSPVPRGCGRRSPRAATSTPPPTRRAADVVIVLGTEVADDRQRPGDRLAGRLDTAAEW